METCFEANEMTNDGKNSALLIAALGPPTVLCRKVTPRKPNSLTLAEVLALLDDYYNTKPNEMYRCQEEGETIHTFFVEIVRIAVIGNFTSMVDRMLWDRIVCGVRSKKLQKQLLAKLRPGQRFFIDNTFHAKTREHKTNLPTNLFTCELCRQRSALEASET